MWAVGQNWFVVYLKDISCIRYIVTKTISSKNVARFRENGRFVIIFCQSVLQQKICGMLYLMATKINGITQKRTKNYIQDS